MFKLTIKTDNAAFTDETARGDERDDTTACNQEVARILREIAHAIERGTRGAPIHDVYGNKCGRFDFTATD